jgi:hypothetical protein
MSFDELEQLGREQLSSSFFMREFLHSEISQISGIANIPHYPDIAIRNGSHLCKKILEPLQDNFGRLFIRSGYRTPEINALGADNRNQYRCASNKRNFSKHIWDYPDKNGHYGAMACIVVPSYLRHYEKSKDWKSMADWIRRNIDECSDMTFYPKLCAFNVSWHQKPNRKTTSYIRK